MDASKETLENLINNASLAVRDLYLLAKQDIAILNACDDSLPPILRMVPELRKDIEFILSDMYSSYRAVINAQTPIEKRLNLKNFRADMHESFKLLYGFGSMRQHTTWAKIGKKIRILSDSEKNDNYRELQELYDTITTSILAIESTEEEKDNRELTYHYDDDLLKVYQNILDTNDEEKFSQRLISIMATLQDVLRFLHQIEFLEGIKGYQLPKVETVGISLLFVQRILANKLYGNGRLREVLDHILKNSSQIDDAARLEKGMCAFKEYALSQNPLADIPEADNMINLANTQLLLQIMLVDIATIVNAYVHSGSDPEYALTLRRLTITRVSTLSHLYGYSDTERSKSLWTLICNMIPEGCSPLISELEKIQSALEGLIDDADKKKRALYAHLMDKRKSNVPNIISGIENINLIEEFSKADALLRVTKRVQNFLKDLMDKLGKDAHEKAEASKAEMNAKFRAIREAVNNSNCPEDIRKSINEQTDKFERIINDPLSFKK